MLLIKGKLEIAGFYDTVFKGAPVELDKDVLETVQKSFDFLKEFSENKVIYGVNTGFGPMAQYKIEDSERLQLQFNLIRSHSSGIS